MKSVPYFACWLSQSASLEISAAHLPNHWVHNFQSRLVLSNTQKDSPKLKNTNANQASDIIGENEALRAIHTFDPERLVEASKQNNPKWKSTGNKKKKQPVKDSNNANNGWLRL